MTRSQKRLLVILVILVLALAALAAYFYFYQQTKKLTFDVTQGIEGTFSPPEYMFSFSGTDQDRMQRPVGVLVSGPTVYVADSRRGRVQMYDLDGKLIGSFEGDRTRNPLYLAQNPKDSNIYVTDRELDEVLIFRPNGKYVGKFEPNLPKSERPKFKTGGVDWVPLAIAFAPDGRLYVTELLNGHRLIIFDAKGKFVRSIGTAGIPNNPKEAPELNQFPNGLLVVDNELYMADSNNRRVKVYDLEGNFKRFIVTAGLPRGLVALDRFPGDDKKTPRRFVEVDTLAHDLTIWNSDGTKVMSFGEQGILEGQFNYPDSVSRGPKNKLYVTDTANGRVQVWGWPAQAASLPPIPAKNFAWCLLPLLLLPLLLLLRKRAFFATADFVEAMVMLGRADLLPAKRRRWITTEAEYEKIRVLKSEDVDLEALFEPVPHSESDVAALMERYELEHENAVILATGKRTKLVGTEDEDLRRLWKLLDVPVVEAREFIDRFDKKSA